MWSSKRHRVISKKGHRRYTALALSIFSTTEARKSGSTNSGKVGSRCGGGGVGLRNHSPSAMIVYTQIEHYQNT